MTEKLSLTQATELLAELKNKPRIKNDNLGIIRAGVAGKIPVYWFNDLQISTRISNFKGDLPTTYWDGPEKIKKIKFLNDPNQLTSTSLRELTASDSTIVMDFELTDHDFDMVAKMQGSIVDQDGNLNVYRHPATNSGTVTISRDQLFVFESDLKAYAKTLSPPAKGVTQTAATESQQTEPPESASGNTGKAAVKTAWSLKPLPKKLPGYRKPLYDTLKLMHQNGESPNAQGVLDVWRKDKPGGIIDVMNDSFEYATLTGSRTANLETLSRAIQRLIEA